MAFLIIMGYQLFLKKKIWNFFFLEFSNFYFAKNVSFIVRINILKFEICRSKNEKVLLAAFNFSLLALVLRTSASGSFAASPSGCVNNTKVSRQNLPILNCL